MTDNRRPLVTIGIPTYNRPEGLAWSLSRAVAQTYGNLDIVISDNGSADEAGVRAAIAPYLGDARVRFFRQPANLGSLGNFIFLTEQAKGEYFLWMADDDDVELNYIEELVRRLGEVPNAAIVFGGYDIEDRISNPVIRLNLTRYLRELEGATAYDRLKAYVQQPDHLAKSRLNWGMFPTPLIRRAFAECRKHIEPGATPIWADFPVDMRLLSYGELSVILPVLWHVKLLPTSDGRAEILGNFAKLKHISEHNRRAFVACIQDSSLSDGQKRELVSIVSRRSRKEIVQLFVYYRIIGRWPLLARWVKKIWYVLFS